MYTTQPCVEFPFGDEIFDGDILDNAQRIFAS